MKSSQSKLRRTCFVLSLIGVLIVSLMSGCTRNLSEDTGNTSSVDITNHQDSNGEETGNEDTENRGYKDTGNTNSDDTGNTDSEDTGYTDSEDTEYKGTEDDGYGDKGYEDKVNTEFLNKEVTGLHHTESTKSQYQDSVVGNSSILGGNQGMTGESLTGSSEEYVTGTEFGFQSTRNFPFSGFSVEGDTASYSNIRKAIRGGSVLNPETVKIEEMLNYFSYDYKLPTGNETFGVTTELSNCPWNQETKLLLVGVTTQEIMFKDSIPANLVFLIDVSDSMMESTKLPLVQKAFLFLAKHLRENDRVSIVTYGGADSVVLNGATGTEKAKISDAINQLQTSSSTYGSKGIHTAYEIARENFIKGGNNRVILVTDGDLNVGVSNESELKKLIEEKRKGGVRLSVLGLGLGNRKDKTMQALADNGNGTYVYLDSLLEAKKVLVEEIGGTIEKVASDASFQIEFNPTKVKGYRLLGYDNRRVATEDFAENSIDGEEVGTGNCVTALYELALTDSTVEIPTEKSSSEVEGAEKTRIDGIGTESRATEVKDREQTVSGQEQSAISKEPTAWGEELLSVNLQFKKPSEEISTLFTYPVKESLLSPTMPKNLAFASAVAEFGLLLKESPYRGEASYDSLLQRLSDLTMDGDSDKEELKQLVKKAAGLSYTTK